MAAVKCVNCGSYSSIKGASTCPKCGNALIAPSTENTTAINNTIATTPKGMTAGEWIGAIALLTIIGLIAFIIWMVAVPSEEKKRDKLVSKALLNCQYAIRGAAKFGDAELPPYVKNHGSKNEFYFAWPNGSFHFTNGFGAKEKMSASCIGELDTGTIKSITLNGQDIN